MLTSASASPVEFAVALVAIIIIDLVLAGDNAIIIAMVARELPKKLQFRAIVWGTTLAIIIRAVATIGVLWGLLEVPLLLAIGGFALLWIAFRLGAGKDTERSVRPVDNMRSAIITLALADTVMSLDNVLSVAGAAQGAQENSYGLVVFGLVLSIPIMVLGSRIVLSVMTRYPQVIAVGAFLIAWTGMRMIFDDPVIREAGFVGAVIDVEFVRYALEVAVGLIITAAALWRRSRRTAARGTEPDGELPGGPGDGEGPIGDL